MEIPRLTGYSPSLVHRCPLCDAPVRIVYSLTEVGAPKPQTHVNYKIMAFDGGLTLVSFGHEMLQPGGYRTRWNTPICDYKVMGENAGGPTTVAQAVYDRLLVFPERPSRLRIVSFDVARFLSSPFIGWAKPDQDWAAPLAMVPSEDVLRQAVVHKVDARRARSLPLDWSQQVGAAAEFLKIIAAEVEQIA